MGHVWPKITTPVGYFGHQERPTFRLWLALLRHSPSLHGIAARPVLYGSGGGQCRVGRHHCEESWRWIDQIRSFSWPDGSLLLRLKPADLTIVARTTPS